MYPPLVPTPYDPEHSRCFPERSEAPLEADAPCLCFGGRVAAESLEKAGAARGIRTPDPIITNEGFLVFPFVSTFPRIAFRRLFSTCFIPCVGSAFLMFPVGVITMCLLRLPAKADVGPW